MIPPKKKEDRTDGDRHSASFSGGDRPAGSFSSDIDGPSDASGSQRDDEDDLETEDDADLDSVPGVLDDEEDPELADLAD